MEAKNIYLVEGSYGMYAEDSYEWVIGVTFDEEIAKQLKAEYDEEHFGEIKLPITIDEYNKLFVKYSDEKYYDYKNDEFRFDVINNPNFTQEICDLVDRYEEQKHCEYHPATITLKKVFY